MPNRMPFLRSERWVVTVKTNLPQGLERSFRVYDTYEEALKYEKQLLKDMIAEIETERCKHADPGK